MSVLLVFPPFGKPGRNYLAMPVLSAYLKSRNIPVDVLDANNEFYLKFINYSIIKKGIEYAEDRFLYLNNKAGISFSEAYEYIRLHAGLAAWEKLAAPLETIGTLNHEMPPVKQRVLTAAAIHLSSLPYFPEVIDILPSFQFSSPHDPYSSRSIIEGSGHTGMYGEILRGILSGALSKKSYRIVGLSVCFSSQVIPAFHCARVIRELAPHLHITAGGSFVSSHMRDIRNQELFQLTDSFISDDGERPLEMLYHELSKPQPEPGEIPGISFRRGNKVFRNEPGVPPAIESLPDPDYSYVPDSFSILSGKESPVLFRLARGCHWGRCAFCRTKLPIIGCHHAPPADFLYCQMKRVMEQTGSRLFHFSDDSAPHQLLESLCKSMLRDDLQVRWITSMRFDESLSIERCLTYRQAGGIRLNLGMESLNDRLLMLMEKGISTDLIRKVLSSMKWAGMPVQVFMMVGFPTETEEEAAAGYRELEKLVSGSMISNYTYSPFAIMHHSSVFSAPGRYGITRITWPEDQDLAPSIHEFGSSGMTGKRAFHLAHVFNNPGSPGGVMAPETGGMLPVRGKSVHVRFSVNAVKEAIASAPVPPGYVSHAEWLRQNDDALPLFMPTE